MIKLVNGYIPMSAKKPFLRYVADVPIPRSFSGIPGNNYIVGIDKDKESRSVLICIMDENFISAKYGWDAKDNGGMEYLLRHTLFGPRKIPPICRWYWITLNIQLKEYIERYKKDKRKQL